jgi:hypothetical protein
MKYSVHYKLFFREKFITSLIHVCWQEKRPLTQLQIQSNNEVIKKDKKTTEGNGACLTKRYFPHL